MRRSWAGRLQPVGGQPGLPHEARGIEDVRIRSAVAIVGLIGLAWLLAELPLLWTAALIAAGGGGLVLLRFPHLIWVGLAVALPFASGFKMGPLSLSDLMLGAAILLWFLDGVRKGRLRLTPSLMPLLFSGYLAALLLSFTQAIDVREALEGVIKWLQMLLIILLIPEALSPRQARWLVWGLLTGGALQAALGVYQFVFRIGPPHFLVLERFMRAAGTFGQPNPFAGYLGLTLPVAVALLLANLSSIFGRRPAGLGRALMGASMYSAAAGLIGIGLLASWSRGGWLGAAAGVGVVLYFHSGKIIKVAALAGGASLLLVGPLAYRFIPRSLTDRVADLPAYLGGGMWETVQQPVTDSNFSVIERLAHWIAALRMWEMSPWLGVGPGNYAAVYPHVRLPRWEDPLGHAHNTYLNVLAENGLIGLIAYLALWTGVVCWLICVRRRAMHEGLTNGRARRATPTGPFSAVPSPAWKAAFFLGVAGVVVHLSVHHLFDNLFVQGMYLHVALWLGAAAALAVARPCVPPAARAGDCAVRVGRRNAGYVA